MQCKQSEVVKKRTGCALLTLNANRHDRFTQLELARLRHCVICDLHVNPHWCACSAVIPSQTSQQREPITTPMYETVRPTLPREIVRSTLLQETVQPTPGIVPHPDGSPVPIVTAAIVVTLLVIVLGVALTVILVWARRKKQESEIKKFQTAVINMEYDDIQKRQSSTQIEMKENDAYQQTAIRVSPHTDNAVVYDEVRVGMTNPGAGYMMEENKAYDWHLQRGEAATVSPSDEVEYEEI